MPQIEIEISGDNMGDLVQIIEDAAEWNGYPLQIPNPENLSEMIDNPQSAIDFLKQWFGSRIIGDAKMQQKEEAMMSAKQDVEDNFPVIDIM